MSRTIKNSIGFTDKLLNFLKACITVLAILTVSAVSSLLIAYPLWVWASKSGKTFTAAVLISVFLLAACGIIKRISRKDPGKDSGPNKK